MIRDEETESVDMKITPNIAPPLRILYCAIGLALIVIPFVVSLQVALRVALPVLGVLSIVGGATGW